MHHNLGKEPGQSTASTREIGLHLFDLPTEIRAQVIENLSTNDVLQLRLVNSQLKKEIEEHQDFRICIDQFYRGFRRLCKFRVNTCTIRNLTHQNIHQESIFSFPQRLKKLILDGNISQMNLFKIMKFCPEIELLKITHQTFGIDNLFQNKALEQCLKTNLSKLSTLDVQLIRHLNGKAFDVMVNMNILLSLTLPNLKRFNFYFSVWGCYYLPLFLFIERHARTLKELDLQVGDRGDLKNTELFLSDRRAVNFRIREKLNMNKIKSLQLNKFNFRDDVLNLNASVTQLLFEIISQQRHLQVFEFHSPGELSVEFLKKIINNNESTLSEMAVYNLKNSPVPQNQPQQINPYPNLPFDMSIFNRCRNLKTLGLSFNTVDTNGVESLTVRAFNLNLIPRCIESIHLIGFQMDLQEIIQLSRNSVNLKEVLIGDAGIMKYSSVLGCFLKNCEKLTYLNVRPVNTRANGDAAWWREVEELTKLYNHFMGMVFDINSIDTEGFEATITESDKVWLNENISMTF